MRTFISTNAYPSITVILLAALILAEYGHCLEICFQISASRTHGDSLTSTSPPQEWIKLNPIYINMNYVEKNTTVEISLPESVVSQIRAMRNDQIDGNEQEQEQQQLVMGTYWLRLDQSCHPSAYAVSEVMLCRRTSNQNYVIQEHIQVYLDSRASLFAFAVLPKSSCFEENAEEEEVAPESIVSRSVARVENKGVVIIEVIMQRIYSPMWKYSNEIEKGASDSITIDESTIKEEQPSLSTKLSSFFSTKYAFALAVVGVVVLLNIIKDQGA